MTDEFKSQSLWSRIQGKLRVGKHSNPGQFLLALRPNINWKDLASRLQSLDLQKAIDWVSKKVQDPRFVFYGKLATIVVCNYFLADLSALIIGDYLPNPASQGGRTRYALYQKEVRLNSNYEPIIGRNLFSSRGLIPGEEDQNNVDSNAAPVKTSLPLNLIGTLIMSNPAHSLATIEDKSMSQIFPIGVDDEVPGKIKVQSIEARRVIFINKASGRKEYIELPEEHEKGRPPTRLAGNTGGGPTGAIEKISPTQFNIPRSEVDRALADFNNLLTQARAVPNSENGLPAGYKLFQIIPGSLYDKLGLQNGDVITGLNGQVMNDPGKAFEMMNELKTSNHLELQIKKDGKPITYTYDIHP